MSRAKEIREKQELQAKLALAFNKKRQTVLSWLGNDDNQNDEKNIEHSKFEFMNLPVIATGSILNLNDNKSNNSSQQVVDNKTEIGTIGECLKSEKKISSLTKKRNHNNNKSIVSEQFKVQKNDNKATAAFKNKMRDSSRDQLRKNSKNENNRNFNKEDSDSDDEDRFKRVNIKKKANNMPLQFGKKNKK